MKLTRFFFISESLHDLERFEQSLERIAVVTPQMHLLTLDDSGAATHPKLHQITSFMHKDIIHSTLIGAALGVGGALLVLVVSHLAGWAYTPAGWMPFLFLAIVVLGFLTWQGGLWGIQTPNTHFKSFEQALRDGKHVFFVDVEPRHRQTIEEMARNHHAIETAGVASGAPNWLVFSQHRLKRFFTETFP
ncbi:hypothetical protein [Salinisphaera aquimarina]|uniref:NAD/FAD-utilizing enzyme n=1 Tax=Salinisphaera aquimarina TaxID=2094031 RepID=A0ABV7ETJ2_9GAMM